MLGALKKIVPLSIKRAIRNVVGQENIQLPDGPRALVFLAADYGNIGDLAITAAQRSFLSRSVPGHQLVTVPISQTRDLIRSIGTQVQRGDLVTIIGGGNMGSLYPDIEELRQLVIRSFPRNKIVCFPQTLDWSESRVSKKALQRIVRVYSQHQDIHVFARESITNAKLTELFNAYANVKVGYVPDIVLSATGTELGVESSVHTSGILLCMRDDRERALDPVRRVALERALADTGLEVKITDTHAGGSGLNEARCSQLLAGKLNQFGAARLVVTDRLHGMILSLLAGTPCLVLPNSNHKIRQTWQDWLTGLPQVKFVEPHQLSELPSLVSALLATPRRDPECSPLDISQYHALIDAVTP